MTCMNASTGASLLHPVRTGGASALNQHAIEEEMDRAIRLLHRPGAGDSFRARMGNAFRDRRQTEPLRLIARLRGGEPGGPLPDWASFEGLAAEDLDWEAHQLPAEPDPVVARHGVRYRDLGPADDAPLPGWDD